ERTTDSRHFLRRSIHGERSELENDIGQQTFGGTAGHSSQPERHHFAHRVIIIDARRCGIEKLSSEGVAPFSLRPGGRLSRHPTECLHVPPPSFLCPSREHRLESRVYRL